MAKHAQYLYKIATDRRDTTIQKEDKETIVNKTNMLLTDQTTTTGDADHNIINSIVDLRTGTGIANIDTAYIILFFSFLTYS